MKKLLSLTLAALAALVVSCRADIENPLPRENDPAVQAAMDAYVAEAAETGIPINSIMVIRHGKVLAEAYVNGWSPRKPHHMWSTTKTFTSMAVGLAVEEGLLSLDDRMVDILSEEAAPVLDTIADGPGKEYLLSATIRDYLVMGNGQDADVMFAVCDKYGLPRWIDDKGKIIDFAFSTKKVNMISETFAQPFKYVPGTHNFYNNEGSHLLSCAVQKVTGEKVEDYLYLRLFEPLGIEKPFWDEIQGHTSGGWGLYLRPEDMAKFGLCLLNGGRFNGKQILPESYVREASQRYFSWGAPSWASPEEGRSYFQGYGYQIWMNSDAFCCSGAQGQFICMIPEFDMVIVSTAEIRDDDHKEMALIWKHFLP